MPITMIYIPSEVKIKRKVEALAPTFFNSKHLSIMANFFPMFKGLESIGLIIV